MQELQETPNTVKYKNTREYRAAYKLAAIQDLVSNKESDNYIGRKYGFSSGFMSILKKDMLEKQGYFRILEQMRKKDKPDKTAEELATENEELKKALELSMMKVAALETLIDVVDDQLNIDIRKKGGSKQSK